MSRVNVRKRLTQRCECGKLWSSNLSDAIDLINAIEALHPETHNPRISWYQCPEADIWHWTRKHPERPTPLEAKYGRLR